MQHGIGTIHERFGKKVSSRWHHQGYGTSLDLRIYVYEDWEVPGLKELQRGRDHNIDPRSCAKGQWGTQVGWLVKLWCKTSSPYQRTFSLVEG